MKSTILPTAFALLAFLLPGRGTCDHETEKADKEIDRIQKFLAGHPIQTKALPKDLPLSEFLAKLEGLLPKGGKVALRVDAEAFGKDLAKVMGTKITGLPADGRAMTLDAVLRIAQIRVNDAVRVEYGIRDGAVVMTLPRLAMYSATYLVGDIVEQTPQHRRRRDRAISPQDKYEAGLYDDVEATDGLGLLVRQLTHDVRLESWETIQVCNGIRLTVHASPRHQGEIADLLTSLRRWADTAVMNARLYEVDRAVFAKHVAPHFAKDEKTSLAPTIVQIDSPLLKILTRQKLLGESEDRKLIPEQEAVFLARQSVFRFEAGPMPGDVGRKKTGTGLEGVSFRVRPLISADRRFLTLRITQNVVQLVDVVKTSKLDASTGKEVVIESPNLRKTSVRGTVTMPDGDAIVMPVDYRVPGKGGEDKVWLLVARPMIWIEEEAREIRRQGRNPLSIWKYQVPKEERAEKPR